MQLMTRGKIFRYVTTILLLLLTTPSLVSSAATPLQVIQSGTDKALEILRSRDAAGRLNLRARRAEIMNIVDDYFDFHEMARRALGRPWRSQPPAKQEEFVRLFKDMLFNTYVDRVEAMTSADERVVYDSDQIQDNHALVRTRVIGYRNTDVPVDYRLLLVDGEWKVYDVVVEGISLVSNYRSQFSSILARQSFDDLLAMMRKRVTAQARS